MTKSQAEVLARSAGSASTVVVRQGFGPLSVLGIIFVLCKIFAVAPIAAWSWWLVLLPFYFGIAFVLAIWGVIVVGTLAILALWGLFYVAAKITDAWRYRHRVKPARTKKRFP